MFIRKNAVKKWGVKVAQQLLGISQVGKSRNMFQFEKWLPYLLIIPTLILIAFIMIYPIGRVFGLSLQSYSFAKVYEMGKMIGLRNFGRIFTEDTVFYGSLWITLKWVIVEVGFQLVFGLLIALMLNRAFRGRGIVRALTFIPWAVSGVLTTMLWTLLLNQQIGLVNYIFKSIGLIRVPVAWLASPKTVFGSIIVAELWRGLPFFAITLLAALQGIPNELYEASDMDGCNGWQRLVYVTLPFLKEAIIFSTLMRIIWEFNSIDMIFTMTNGGPFQMTTTLPIYLMQTSIIEGDYGYGSALAVVTFLILLIFAVVYLKISKFGSENDA
jgi:multiple sugar transport system permease protein